jgi:ATP-binding cassette subfamily B protein
MAVGMVLNHFSISQFLWHYVLKDRWKFAGMVFCMGVWALNESLFPYFIKMIVDTASALNPAQADLWHDFKRPVGGLAFSWLMLEIFMRVYRTLDIYTFPAFRDHIRQDVFDYVKGQSLEYFSQNMGGSIGQKIADIPRSAHQILESYLWYIIPICTTFLISLCFLAQANWMFAVIMFVWCLSHLGVNFIWLKKINQRMTSHYQSLARLNGEIMDVLNNAMSMKLFSRLRFETQRLKSFRQQEVKRSQSAGWVLWIVTAINGFGTFLLMLAVVYFLLKFWKEGTITVGDFPLVAISVFNLIGLIWQMSFNMLDLFRDLGTLKGAVTLLQHPISVQDAPNAKKLVVTKGAIDFQHVSFGYRQRTPLFSDLSVSIKAGEKVGLVGFSGSGKTTFVNLILRAYDIRKGGIFIDGQDITGVTQESLRQQISLIQQSPSLFHRSIMDNIRYGRLEATDEEVKEAARFAHCDKFIEQMENTYDTLVGENSLNLSGGQGQRLAIARAFLKKAPILILDEATSALDSITENLIQDSLNVLMEGRTTLVIAHRLSTLKAMDRILVFDKGVLVEQGTQRELLAKNQAFAHLWTLQKEGFLPQRDT